MAPTWRPPSCNIVATFIQGLGHWPQMRILLPFLVGALVLSGCIADPGQDGQEQETPVRPAAFTTGNDAEGCTLVVAVVQVSFEQAASAIPEGYEPADAQELLDLPVAVGNAAVLITGYACASGEADPEGFRGAEVNILIKPPQAANTSTPADTHYYLLGLTTDHDAFGAPLDRANGTRIHAPVKVQVDIPVDALPLPVNGQTTVGKEDGLGYAIDVQSVLPNTLTGLSRFWQETPTGTAWYDYHVEADVLVGTATCDITTGSIAHQAIGSTECPPEATLGIIVPEFSWQSTFHFQPRTQD